MEAPVVVALILSVADSDAAERRAIERYRRLSALLAAVADAAARAQARARLESALRGLG